MVVVALPVAFILFRCWRSVGWLHLRNVVEMKQLHALLTERHLIVSHLLDALPPRFNQSFDRDGFCKTQQAAESLLKQIDPTQPRTSEFRRHAQLENDLNCMLENLIAGIAADKTVCQLQPVVGCLKGLESSTKRIHQAVSIYNASAITLATCLESRLAGMVADLSGKRREFCLFEWGDDTSAISTDTKS
jgi:hypothetical protein